MAIIGRVCKSAILVQKVLNESIEVSKGELPITYINLDIGEERDAIVWR